MLVDSDAGPLLALAPREGFEDAVLGFALIGDGTMGSNWPVRLSFPVFVLNLLEYFGGGRDALNIQNVRPGQSVTFRLDTPATSLTLVPPAGSPLRLSREPEQPFRFAGTERVGVYELQADSQPAARFAVNLLDSEESKIRPRGDQEIQIGHVKVAGERSYEVGRRDVWKLLALARWQLCSLSGISTTEEFTSERNPRKPRPQRITLLGVTVQEYGLRCLPSWFGDGALDSSHTRFIYRDFVLGRR